MPNTEEQHALAGLTEEERRLAADDEPAIEADPAPAPELREEPSIPLRVTIPENAHEILSQIEQQRDYLAQQFDDGDITAKEYRDAMDRIASQREQIEWQFKKADLAHEMRQTAERDAWVREVNDFMTSGPGATISRSHVQMTAFDQIVRDVTADPANASLSDRAQLDLAWRRYREDSARAGLGDGLDVAQSLGSMGNSRSYDDGGMHAQLDRMAMNGDVAGIERALARMTPAERDAYGY